MIWWSLLFSVLAGAALLAPPATAADWGPHGHSEITYDAATGDKFGLPSEIAKVMALGSLAPDYFEFHVPAAHAQVTDPKIENNRLTVSESEYRELQRDAFVDSFNWHEFYFNAAATAMQHGQRERAAFLLGYALHNVEDLGTHQGMPNLVHASLDVANGSPDASASRLALSHAGASLDIAAFRQKIGEDNWQLFQGQAVRRGGETIVPEPMLTFGELGDWDPRSGILPIPADSSWLKDPARTAFRDTFKKAADEFGYSVELSGQLDASKTTSIYNFLEGLLPRQDAMIGLLDVSELGIERRTCDSPALGECDPDEPTAKDAALLWRYIRDVMDFAYRKPKQFAALSADDRALLESTNWLDVAGEQQRMLNDRKLEAQNKLMGEYTDRINTLTKIVDDRQLTLRWLEIWRKRLQQIQAKWDSTTQWLNNLQPPTADGRPASAASSGYQSAPDPPTTPSYSENRMGHYEQRGEGRSSGGITFSSPSYNFGSSSHFGFDR